MAARAPSADKCADGASDCGSSATAGAARGGLRAGSDDVPEPAPKVAVEGISIVSVYWLYG
eukprot:12314324-Alexandrium_andersonii.AAC.1